MDSIAFLIIGLIAGFGLGASDIVWNANRGLHQILRRKPDDES